MSAILFTLNLIFKKNTEKIVNIDVVISNLVYYS